MYRNTDGVSFDVGQGSALKTPPKGWSVAGNLFTPGPSGERDGRTVSLQQQFPEPGAYTVELALVIPPDVLGGPTTPRANALIEWSVAGNTISRQVTISDGMSITGVAEGVRVVITDTSNTNLTPAVEYGVVASVVKGSRPTSEEPPIYYGRTILVFNAQVDVTVPQNIGANSIFLCTNFPRSNGEIRMTQYDGSNNIIVDTILTPEGAWIPLGPGVQKLSFFPVVSPLTLAARITIMYGIDG